MSNSSASSASGPLSPWSAVAAVFTHPRLGARVALTLLIAVAYSVALRVPGPGVDVSAVQFCEGLSTQGAYAALSVISGGGALRLSPVALGIMPFITAMIAWLLLSRVVPSWRRKVVDGTAGRTQYTFIVVVGLALAVGTALSYAFAAQVEGRTVPGCTQKILADGVPVALVAAAVMVVGACVVLGAALLITKFGVGNGFSVIIVTGILTSVPFLLSSVSTKTSSAGVMAAVAALALLVFGVVAFSTRSTSFDLRRVPAGRDCAEASSRVAGAFVVPANPAGILPIILASILAYAPSVVAHVLPAGPFTDAVGVWMAPGSWVQLLVVALLTVAFTFYFVISGWDSPTADAHFADAGVGIADVPAGEPTMDWVDAVLTRRTVRAAGVLAALAVVPAFAASLVGLPVLVAMGGPTVLVLVAAALSIGGDVRRRAALATGTAVPEDMSLLMSGSQANAIDIWDPAPSPAVDSGDGDELDGSSDEAVGGNRAARRAARRAKKSG